MSDSFEQLELDNRIKNLLWTVSGDYDLDVKLDTQGFEDYPYIPLYEAIKQGAFAKYFNQDELSMYLIKKLYFGADSQALLNISKLCVDISCCDRILKERKGVSNIRKRAFEELMERDYEAMNQDEILGRIRFAFLRDGIDGSYDSQKYIENVLTKIKKLKNAHDVREILETIDFLYNRLVDTEFEMRYGDLDFVLQVSLEDLSEFDWKDFMEEEAYEDSLERMIDTITNAVTTLPEEQKEKEKRRHTGSGTILLNEEAVRKMYSYIELNYGTSYLSELEQNIINRRLCTGVHGDSKLYYTDGIIDNYVKENSTYVLAKKTKELNLKVFRQNYRLTWRNIEILTDTLRNALITMNEEEQFKGEYGQILVNDLWKATRTDDRRLFVKKYSKPDSDFVVSLLIDASGSQRARQSYVALQGYIVSRALSEAGIPHEVMGFCTFWDYTVMRRFRDYDEGREADRKIFEFFSSSNNRDGLAIKAACDSLLTRTETNKILIVLSDGRPNDIIVNRPNAKNKSLYTGDYALKDTATQVRMCRGHEIAVLGVFTGEEEDLLAEHRIFGKDFAYIKDISNFSNVVGRYLRKQMEGI